MYRRILPLLIIGSITVAYADSAVQADWSGGPGVWGPVTEFGIEYYSDSGIACYSESGDIALGMIDNVVGHNVAWDFEGAASVYSEDIDGDGDMDILGAAVLDDYITWWENLDGSGTSWTAYTIDEDFYHAESIYSEDIDGDGDMDVLGASSGDDEITWWENVDGTGTAWTEQIIDGSFLGAMSVYSEDIDGDGDMDVLGASMGLNEISWWENADSIGTLWIKHIVDGHSPGAHSIYSEDIDGDGDMDVIGSKAYSVDWWENVTGSGNLWVHHTVEDNFSDPRCVYSEDIDGDGDMDVLGAANGSGISDDISWWENADGTGTSWVKHIVDGSFWGARSVYSADMDNDGDMDIIGACYYQADRDITWWENLNGSGTSWGVHLVDGNVPGAASVYSEDINGDGIMDILGASRTWDFIAWWEVLSYPPEGSLVSSVLDTECSPFWDTIDWSGLEPAETSIGFQLRSSNDPDSIAMGSWSDILYLPCSLEGILTDGEQYVQYMVILETSNPDITPTLWDVMLTWDPLAISGDTGPDSFELLPFYPNPTCSAPSLRFCLPEISSIEFSIFDVSGRLVSIIPSDEYPAGYHSIVLDELSPGIYFCKMVSEDFTSTQRFLVVE